MKSTESTSGSNAKYKPHKNNSLTSQSPMHVAKPYEKRHKRRKARCKAAVDEEEDDFTISSTSEKHSRTHLKNYIKKRLNNNYEKQINCLPDENVVFTDNKIYISLAARNSSLTSSIGGHSSLKKNRRIIYPTSDGFKLNGFWRDFDFNYESPTKTVSFTPTTDNDDKLQFDLLKENISPSPNAFNSVVFEKVKVKQSPIFGESKRNDKNTLSSSRLDIHQGPETDDDDDLQWKSFVEIRKHGKKVNCDHDKCQISIDDSGFGSQIFSNTCSFDKNLKKPDAWLSEENFDNSFNEELEQRVSCMFPELSKDYSQTTHNNKNNFNHEINGKYS